MKHKTKLTRALERCLFGGLVICSVYFILLLDVSAEEPAAGDSAYQADVLFEERRFPEAFALYAELARKGDRFSQYRLAYLYEHGLGGERDLQEAFAWASVAADISELQLVEYWQSLRQMLGPAELESATTKALNYYRQYFNTAVAIANQTPARRPSYNRRASQARRNIPPDPIDEAYLLYLNGDDEAAFEAYLHLAKSGDKFSQYRLATMYQAGRGTATDPVAAYAWARLAEEFGQPLMQEYYFRLRQTLSSEELAAGKNMAVDYFRKYGQIGLAQRRIKKINKQLFSCTGSRVGNSCAGHLTDGALTADVVCLDPEKCIDKKHPLIPMWKLYIEAIKSKRLLNVFIDQYIEAYGQVILGDLEIIEDDPDQPKKGD